LKGREKVPPSRPSYENISKDRLCVEAKASPSAGKECQLAARGRHKRESSVNEENKTDDAGTTKGTNQYISIMSGV